MKTLFICFILFTIVMLNQNISIYAQVSPESSEKISGENDTQISHEGLKKKPSEGDLTYSYESLERLGRGENNAHISPVNEEKVLRKIHATIGGREEINKYNRGCSHLTRCRD
ncbi:unnamed protein product [Lathyrus oleraceus]|uniref:Uncharacterized protein n=1 Tax=Pisum sativum TaxID=3888 RepID=A0A9D5APJ9_PEA|nr:hypothetical protein KIW84_043795 [Pisum sativum]